MDINTTYTSSTIYSGEQVQIRSARSLIENTSYPMSDVERSLLQDLIQEEGESLKLILSQGRSAELNKAVAERDVIRAPLARVVSDLSVAEKDLSLIEREPEPGWTKAIISALCAISCFAAEFVLTWHALTFLLDVPKDSVLGVLLGLAPPSALAVLELVILRLFESPWQKLHAASNLPVWRRIATASAMILLLVALGWANIYTVLLLAEAREEATKTMHNLSSEDIGEVAPLDTAVVRRAILAVSVCVTLDGAVFLLLGIAEFHSIRRRLSARNKVRRLRTEHDSTARTLHQADAKVIDCQTSVDQSVIEGNVLAERFRKQCLFELEQQLNKSRREMSTGQLVEIGLHERRPV